MVKPKKPNIVKCKISSSSNEEVAINYLSMRNRSSNSFITSEDLYNLSPNRYKDIHTSRKALQTLCLYDYAYTSDNIYYCITQLGLRIPYILASYKVEKKRESRKNNES